MVERRMSVGLNKRYHSRRASGHVCMARNWCRRGKFASFAVAGRAAVGARVRVPLHMRSRAARARRAEHASRQIGLGPAAAIVAIRKVQRQPGHGRSGRRCNLGAGFPLPAGKGRLPRGCSSLGPRPLLSHLGPLRLQLLRNWGYKLSAARWGCATRRRFTPQLVVFQPRFLPRFCQRFDVRRRVGRQFRTCSPMRIRRILEDLLNGRHSVLQLSIQLGIGRNKCSCQWRLR